MNLDNFEAEVEQGDKEGQKTQDDREVAEDNLTDSPWGYHCPII